MKIALLSYKNDGEGAAIAAARICKAIHSCSCDVALFVIKLSINDSTYIKRLSNNTLSKFGDFLRIYFDLLINRLLIKNQKIYFTVPILGASFSRIKKAVANYEIVHLHWVHRGFFTIDLLKKISKLNKSIFITLHDDWFYTGGCHITYSCYGYKDNCSSCHLSRITSIPKYLKEKKTSLFTNSNIVFITPSYWLLKKALESNSINKENIHVIPNGVDVFAFDKIDRELARSAFNLPMNKKIILFFASDDPRKGGHTISKLIKLLEENESYLFVAFGNENISGSKFYSNCKVYSVGKVKSAMMCKLYNAANMLLAPANDEPFGQTYIEAMACQTPCIAFNNSGPSEIITHKIDGYLASTFDVEDLISGIEFCEENEEELGINARKKMISDYSLKVIGEKHISLYRKIKACSD
jgi:glycosyltransferase involved in cell wall biosynthesis